MHHFPWYATQNNASYTRMPNAIYRVALYGHRSCYTACHQKRPSWKDRYTSTAIISHFPPYGRFFKLLIYHQTHQISILPAFPLIPLVPFDPPASWLPTTALWGAYRRLKGAFFPIGMLAGHCAPPAPTAAIKTVKVMINSLNSWDSGIQSRFLNSPSGCHDIHCSLL